METVKCIICEVSNDIDCYPDENANMPCLRCIEIHDKVAAIINETVLVFDPTLYVDDECTPLSTTMKEAVILKMYYHEDRQVVDVLFKHDNRISKAHFLTSIKKKGYIC
jgi:hypothetical protein